jgi:hypothetical protein
VELAELHAAALAQILPVGLDLIGDGGEALFAQLLVRPLEPGLGRLQPWGASPLLLGQLRAGKPRRERVPSGAPAVLTSLQLCLCRSPDGGDGRDEGFRGALKVGGHLDHVVALRCRSPDRPAGERLVGVDTDLGGLAQHGWGRGDQLARFTQQLLSALMDGLNRGGLSL